MAPVPEGAEEGDEAELGMDLNKSKKKKKKKVRHPCWARPLRLLPDHWKRWGRLAGLWPRRGAAESPETAELLGVAQAINRSQA